MSSLITVQPDMPVDPRPFIKPPFIMSGINTHGNDIITIIIQKVSNVVMHSDVTTLVVTEIKSVDPYVGITENPIELKLKTFTRVNSCNSEFLTVPANTGGRK